MIQSDFESKLDPRGLVPALCTHGLRTRPAPYLSRSPRLNEQGEEYAPYGGNSWIRSKYVRSDFRCPVCRGEPNPADLVTPVT